MLWTSGGSIIGTIAGAIKGQTTEVGFLDGAGKGAIAGAIAAIELMSFAYVAVGEPFSKVTNNHGGHLCSTDSPDRICTVSDTNMTQQRHILHSNLFNFRIFLLASRCLVSILCHVSMFMTKHWQCIVTRT